MLFRIFLLGFVVFFLSCSEKRKESDDVISVSSGAVAEIKEVIPASEIASARDKFLASIDPANREIVVEWLTCPPGWKLGPSGGDWQDCWMSNGDWLQRFFRSYPDGRLKERGAIKDGVGREGRLTAWFPNGQRKGEAEWCNGKPCGSMRTWYESGQLSYDTKYDPSGQLLESKYYDRSGREISDVEWRSLNGFWQGGPEE